MTWTLKTAWQPTQLMTFARSNKSSTEVSEVYTDAGRAYIKTLGNPQGPHVLATDWVGTHLARWFGLSTFDIAILTLESDDTFKLEGGNPAEPGPTFAARAEQGETWGRTEEELDELVNPEDITRLVVFDTWTLNCDRHYHDTTVRRPNYDNVYLSSENVEPGKRRLIAMDHGLCFIRSGEELTAKLSNIGKVKDDHVYGLFPEFRKRLSPSTIKTSIARLHEMDAATAEAMIATVPAEWEVSASAREAWRDLILRRAACLADNVKEWIDDALR